MKLASDTTDGTNKIKVKILEVDGEKIKCKHLASGFEVKAYIKNNITVDVGQVVILEYRKNLYNGNYIVFDTLMEEMDAKVLDAQHIIYDDVLYTSLILENTITKQRLHSLVPSSSKLFGNTSIIVAGDNVKLRINNGNLFSMQA